MQICQLQLIGSKSSITGGLLPQCSHFITGCDPRKTGELGEFIQLQWSVEWNLLSLQLNRGWRLICDHDLLDWSLTDSNRDPGSL